MTKRRSGRTSSRPRSAIYSPFGSLGSHDAGPQYMHQLGSLLNGGITVSRVLQHLKSNHRFNETLNNLAVDQVSGRLPNARLGDEGDLLQGGFTNEISGPYVGCFNGLPKFSSSDVSMLILGGSGSGKTSRLASPMAISSALARESVVTISFKPDLAWTTSKGLESIYNHPVSYFAPFGLPWGDSVSFNFYSDVIARSSRGERIADKLRSTTNVIFGPIKKSAGDNSWIAEEAEDVCFLFSAHRCEMEPEKATPPAMADIAHFTQAELLAELELLMQSPACEGLVSEKAKKLYNRFSSSDDAAGKEFRWIMSDYDRAWRLFQKGGALRSSTQNTTYDLSQLKQNPGALHIYIDSQYAISHAAFVRLLLEYIIDTLAHAPGNVRVNIIADEFSQIPRLGNMHHAIRLYREMKIRMILILQDRSGFLHYEKDGGARPFLDNCINLIWGQRDPQILRDLESRAGQQAHLIASANATHGREGDQGSLGIQEHITSVLPGNAVQSINQGRTILDAAGTSLTILDRPMFWDLPFASSYIKNFKEEPIPHF